MTGGVNQGIYAGGGKDTITLHSIASTGVVLNAGAGEDSIKISGTFGSGDFGALQISNFGDSKIGAMDTFDLSGLAAATGGQNRYGTGVIDLAAGTALDLGSTAAAISGIFTVPAVDGATGFTTAVGQSGSVLNGAMSFSGQASAGVATAASYADIITRNEPGNPTGPTAGKAVLFTAGSDEYLFIQGGAAGTADDYVLKFNGVSGSTMTGATVLTLGD